MSDKELYQQKMQAKLDEWKAEVDKLKAKASGASADAQLEMNKQIKALESKIEEGKAKLSELAIAGAKAPMPPGSRTIKMTGKRIIGSNTPLLRAMMIRSLRAMALIARKFIVGLLIHAGRSTRPLTSVPAG